MDSEAMRLLWHTMYRICKHIAVASKTLLHTPMDKKFMDNVIGDMEGLENARLKFIDANEDIKIISRAIFFIFYIDLVSRNTLF